MDDYPIFFFLRLMIAFSGKNIKLQAYKEYNLGFRHALTY